MANSSKHKKSETHGVYTAELMREIGLKCIGLNGVCLEQALVQHTQLTTNIGSENNQLSGSVCWWPAK